MRNIRIISVDIDELEHSILEYNEDTGMGRFKAIVNNVPSQTPMIKMSEEFVEYCKDSVLESVEMPYTDDTVEDVYNYSVVIEPLSDDVDANDMDIKDADEKLVAFYPSKLPESVQDTWREVWLQDKYDNHVRGMIDSSDPYDMEYHCTYMSKYEEELSHLRAKREDTLPDDAAPDDADMQIDMVETPIVPDTDSL